MATPRSARSFTTFTEVANVWYFRYDSRSFHSLGSTFKNSSDRSRIWKNRRVDVVTKSGNLFVSGLTNSEIRFGGSSEPPVSIKSMTINLFSSIETSSSKNANLISSSDIYHKWRLNAVVAASETFLFG